MSAGRKRAACGYGKSVFVGGVKKNLRGSGFAYKNTGEEKILARNSLFAAVSVYCATVTVVGELCPYTPFASAVTVICEPTPRPLILNVSAEV